MEIQPNARIQEGAMTARDIGTDAATMAVALAGLRSGKSHREIATDLYGAEQVAAGWHRDGWMRAKVRRLLHRAQAASGDGTGGASPGTP